MIKESKGLSFIEFLLVSVFLAILGILIIPRFFTSSETSRYSAHLKEVNQINTQIEAFYFKFGDYPKDMIPSSWEGPKGEPSTDFFPFGIPQVTIYGDEWKIINGRVHARKKQDVKKTKDMSLHTKERLTINDSIKRYFTAYKEYPKGMLNADWIGPYGESYRLFYKEGVPDKCNQGTQWTLLDGQIDTSLHIGHE